jgi:hypothetical protein
VKHRILPVPLVVALLTLVLMSSPAGAAVTSTRGASPPAATGASSVLLAPSSPQAKAQAALARSVARLRAGQPRKAVRALRSLAVQVARAQRQAIGTIGKPPSDPESDEPPGPAAVLAVLGLDHRVTSTLVPHVSTQKKVRVVSGLGFALQRTHVSRNRMIGKVVALPPAKGDDYADGMSDVLGQFPSELSQIDAALASNGLTTTGRTTLTKARPRVARANQLMLAEYGGGE